MLKSLLLPLGLIAGLAVPSVAFAQTSRSEEATAIFEEAREICEADGGALWGRSLCGPMLLVTWQDRSAIANQADEGGVLSAEGGLFTGRAPAGQVLANTPVEWSGMRWTQLLWPFPEDEAERRVLLAHELFHRIQRDLGLARGERGNRHLDTLEGRHLLQLEWRALAAALSAPTPEGRSEAISHALTFREARYAALPAARDDEAALQITEGVAEYTGVRLGLDTAEARTAYALRDLEAFVSAPTFIRSFAYASGPAYGLLLDEADQEWKAKVQAGARVDDVLTEALGWRADPSRPAEALYSVYDDGALRRSEETRETARLERVAAWRALLIDGPVLRAPLVDANFQFNPQTLQALDEIGTVYPTLRVSDEWGVLAVEEGALLDAQRRFVNVPAAGLDSSGSGGEGWTLTLNAGWRLEPGPREGDFTIARDPSVVGAEAPTQR